MHSRRAVATPIDVSTPGPLAARNTFTAVALAVHVLALLVIAGLADLIGAAAWLVSLAGGVVAGFTVKAEMRRIFVLALIPATLLTNGDVVPHNGRYVPAVTTIVALVVASRHDLRSLATRASRLPRALLMVLVAYVLVMALAAATSIQRELSFAYLAGSIVTLGVAFLVVPFVSRNLAETDMLGEYRPMEGKAGEGGMALSWTYGPVAQAVIASDPPGNGKQPLSK